MPLSRNTNRILIVSVLAVAIVCITMVATHVWPLHLYAREKNAIRVALDELRQDRRPNTVDANVWEVATGWSITAYENICFSEDCVSITELKRFRTDVEDRFAGDVDLSTVDWLWQRLGETGQHGQEYRRNFEQIYHEHVQYALTNQ